MRLVSDPYIALLKHIVLIQKGTVTKWLEQSMAPQVEVGLALLPASRLGEIIQHGEQVPKEEE